MTANVVRNAEEILTLFAHLESLNQQKLTPTAPRHPARQPAARGALSFRPNIFVRVHPARRPTSHTLSGARRPLKMSILKGLLGVRLIL